MCGITGYLSKLNGGVEPPEVLLTNMANKLVHRGPDAEGVWFDKEKSIGLAHRRLSILDLSSAADQPMTSNSGRYTIVFNGEIYNHLELRNTLNAIWKGHSDTETLLVCFENWGIVNTLEKCLGMFSIAIWDSHKDILTLARDRMGEKPLYYGWQNNTFIFGSELKCIMQHPDFVGKIDRNALCLYFRYNYVPDPASIYIGIKKLGAGCILHVSLENREPRINKFWSLVTTATAAAREKFVGTPDEAVNQLEGVLEKAVGRQMLSDVPVGAFLSGGIDSPTIVSLMQKQSSRPVSTFTIGYKGGMQSEAQQAKAIAKHLGTNHHEFEVEPEDVLHIVDRMPKIFCEPFADSSQIPTYLVSQLARKEVKVALSGDGGDEIFCGYNRYQVSGKFWDTVKVIPGPIRTVLANGLTLVPPNYWNKFMVMLPWDRPGDKLHKGAMVMNSESLSELYSGLTAIWENPESLVIDAQNYCDQLVKIEGNVDAVFNDVEHMMIWDSLSYLPGDILVKVDRASMACSLETRAPFLDKHVIDFAWKLPFEYKLQNGITKWALREVLYNHVPKDLVTGPKKGFGLPFDEWLRGPLREWAETLIDEYRLRSEGFLNHNIVKKKWDEHQSGKRNWTAQLWSILMFQSWLEAQK